MTARILIGLVAGLGLGGMLPGHHADGLFVAAVEPLGTLWLNALMATVIPLVLALVVTGVASAADAASSGGLIARALAVFATLLVAGAIVGVVTTESMLWLWPIPESTAAALRAGADLTKVPPVPPAGELFTSVVPSNLFAALVQGQMLPIVLFGLAFGFAVAYLAAEPRARLIGLTLAIGDVMMVMIDGVLFAAPVGVFALALTVGYRTGWAAAGAVAQYVVVVSVVLIVELVVLVIPAAVIGGRVPAARWIRAVLPAQAVAFTTQSSLATLPTTIERARHGLRLPERVIEVSLPLAVTLFRVTSPAGNLAIVLYLAHLYRIDLSLLQIAAITGIALVGSLATVGVASAATFFVATVPMCAAAGVPIEILPLLLAVEVLPDLWRTVGNVSGHLAAATILARLETAPGTKVAAPS